MNQVILRMEHITKRFPGVLALDDCRLTLARGEVHGLIGENGAGKSTLMKVLCGIYRKDEGQILFEDREVDFANTRESLQSGICMIHQELNLMPHLTVAQNMYINRENEGRRSFFVHDKVLNEKAAHYLEELHVKIPPTTRVRELSVAKQQMVEIAKAISYNSKILIMDEPTAALTDEETEDLFRVVEKLKASGMAIVYISHRMDELKRICDKITIMRDGRYIQTSPMQEITVNEIIAKMVGREVETDVTKTERALGEDYILEVEHLTRRGKFEDVSFKLRRGEILGFSGLMGAGRTEVARALFGADLPDSGTVRADGRVAMLFQEPRLFPALTALENVRLAQPQHDRAASLDALRICRAAALADKRPHEMSGGERQRVALARLLAFGGDILLLDEPFSALDAATKAQIIADLLPRLAGKTVVLVTHNADEAALADTRIEL